MTKLSFALLVVPALLADPPVFGNEPVPEPSRPLTLRIYDHVEIAPDTLHRARKQTSRIFRQFGIETAWLGCPTSPEQLTTNGACRAPLGPTDLVVKILPESMSKKYGLPKGVFGFALPVPARFAFEAALALCRGILFACLFGFALPARGRFSFRAAFALCRGILFACLFGFALPLPERFAFGAVFLAGPDWPLPEGPSKLGSSFCVGPSAVAAPCSGSISIVATEPTLSPSPTLITATPCVDRPWIEMPSILVRSTMPSLEITISSCESLTIRAATTGPVPSLTLNVITPLPPR